VRLRHVLANEVDASSASSSEETEAAWHAVLDSKIDVCALDANGETAFHTLARQTVPPDWKRALPAASRAALGIPNRAGATPLAVVRNSNSTWKEDWIKFLERWEAGK
jgi:hypothetical protein